MSISNSELEKNYLSIKYYDGDSTIYGGFTCCDTTNCDCINDKENAFMIIYLLNKNGFNFTKKHLLHFIKIITDRKSSSLLVRNNFRDCKCLNLNLYRESLKIMFDKCMPTSGQINKMIGCFDAQKARFNDNNTGWIDILNKKDGFDFSDKHKQKLSKNGFSSSYFRDLKDINLDQLKEDLESCTGHKDIDRFKEIITKNNLKIDEVCVNIVIRQASIPSWKGGYSCDKVAVLKFTLFMIEQLSEIRLSFIQKNLKFLNNGIINLIIQRGYINIKDIAQLFIICLNKYPTVCFNIMDYSDFVPTFDQLSSLYSHHLIRHSRFRSMDYYLEKYKIKADMSLLEVHCKTGDFTNYKLTIDKFNFIPDVKCLELVCGSRYMSSKLEFIEHVLQYKIIPTETACLNLAVDIYNWNVVKLCFTLLISYGLRVTYKIIVKFCDIVKELVDVTKYGLEYSDELFYYIHNEKCYTKSICDKFKEVVTDPQYQLRFMSRDATPAIFVKYLKTHKVFPDRYCLEIACTINHKLAKYLIKTLKCKPTGECLVRSSSPNGSQQVFSDVYNELYSKDTDHKYLSKCYDHINLNEI